MMKLSKLFAVSSLLAMTLSVCPAQAAQEIHSNRYWWPKTLDLSPLRHSGCSANPMGKHYQYEEAFQSLDLNAVKKDLKDAMTSSQDWWPADFGHYGPFMIRMAWHSAGTYRMQDGLGGADGGQQRFEPLNSWPDNANLDKARRLLWPIKQKYGEKISWADLMILAGNVALESMGFKTFGFAGGRTDDWQAELVYWGPESEWLGDKRYTGDRQLEKPLAAVQMGLIYVNPEGPNAKPDPLLAAKDIRDTFGRMAMNDEETVALIAGGHTFGKAHGAYSPSKCVGPEPAAEGIEKQGFGWTGSCGKGNAGDTTTSGLEGSWSFDPTAWTTQYLDNLLKYDWVQTKSPAGATQWIPSDPAAQTLAPDAHDKTKRHAPIMFTTDLALKEDPAYRKIIERFKDHPDEYQLAFAKAWFKLTHRDMGPRSRYIGSEVPSDVQLWQDPIPAVDYKLINSAHIADLKKKILASGLSASDLVSTAWASASTFRISDMRGGANGARVRLAPQKDWTVNDPSTLARVLSQLEAIQTVFNQAQKDNTQISLADLIVLGGNAAIEQAAEKAGVQVSIPFNPGRNDATQEQTDAPSFSVLEPHADGFRNYYEAGNTKSPAEMLLEKSSQLHLTVPEMTVLVGGMRALNTNTDHSKNGVFTHQPGVLSNDFFVNLLDMSTQWQKSAETEGLYEGIDRQSGQVKWTATPVDLVFGSNSELRAVAEVYAYHNSKEKFVKDFAMAWAKVMDADRFDLKQASSGLPCKTQSPCQNKVQKPCKVRAALSRKASAQSCKRK